MSYITNSKIRTGWARFHNCWLFLQGVHRELKGNEAGLQNIGSSFSLFVQQWEAAVDLLLFVFYVTRWKEKKTIHSQRDLKADVLLSMVVFASLLMRSWVNDLKGRNKILQKGVCVDFLSIYFSILSFVLVRIAKVLSLGRSVVDLWGGTNSNSFLFFFCLVVVAFFCFVHLWPTNLGRITSNLIQTIAGTLLPTFLTSTLHCCSAVTRSL